jgi:ABC-type dipeptide/oligopeptide/nickel transport system permease subunit
MYPVFQYLLARQAQIFERLVEALFTLLTIAGMALLLVALAALLAGPVSAASRRLVTAVLVRAKATVLPVLPLLAALAPPLAPHQMPAERLGHIEPE